MSDGHHAGSAVNRNAFAGANLGVHASPLEAVTSMDPRDYVWGGGYNTSFQGYQQPGYSPAYGEPYYYPQAQPQGCGYNTQYGKCGTNVNMHVYNLVQALQRQMRSAFCRYLHHDRSSEHCLRLLIALQATATATRAMEIQWHPQTTCLFQLPPQLQQTVTTV